MMCSHTPDTTIPIANPEKPLTKPAPAGLTHRLERVGPRHGPGVAEARIVGAVEQFARAQRRIELCKREHFRRRRALREMDRAQLARMLEAGGPKQLGQRVQR